MKDFIYEIGLSVLILIVIGIYILILEVLGFFMIYVKVRISFITIFDSLIIILAFLFAFPIFLCVRYIHKNFIISSKNF